MCLVRSRSPRRFWTNRALYARRPAHYGTARGGAILVNNLFGTEQGPQALQAIPSVHTYTPHLISVNIHTVCMLSLSSRMSRAVPAPPNLLTQLSKGRERVFEECWENSCPNFGERRIALSRGDQSTSA